MRLDWASTTSLSSIDQGLAVTSDAAGNAYVTGRSLLQSPYVDLLLVKYGPDGAQLWADRYAGPGYSDGRRLELAPDGGIYALGGASPPVQADSLGSASVSGFVPAAARGRTVLFQAYETLTCRVSNVVAHLFP